MTAAALPPHAHAHTHTHICTHTIGEAVASPSSLKFKHVPCSSSRRKADVGPSSVATAVASACGGQNEQADTSDACLGANEGVVLRFPKPTTEGDAIFERAEGKVKSTELFSDLRRYCARMERTVGEARDHRQRRLRRRTWARGTSQLLGSTAMSPFGIPAAASIPHAYMLVASGRYCSRCRHGRAARAGNICHAKRRSRGFGSRTQAQY
jgi:hypothetical protein